MDVQITYDRSFWTAKHHKQKIAFGLVLDSQQEGRREWKISSSLPSRANLGLSIFEEEVASGKVNYAQLCGSFTCSFVAGPEFPEFPLKLKQQKNTKTAHDVPVSAGYVVSAVPALAALAAVTVQVLRSTCTCNNTGEQPFIYFVVCRCKCKAVALPV